MSAALGPRTERVLQIAIDLGERLFLLLLFAAFVVRLSHTLGVRPYNVLALVSEGLMTYFILVRRNAIALTMRPWDWIVAFAGTALPMFVRAGGQAPFPAFVGTVLMFAGVSLAIWAKLTLRRSFGIAAAHRGLVHGGPYRFVRHPMYAGYILVYTGFALNNPLLWNFSVYVLAAGLLVARIVAEEAVLTPDGDYAGYKTRVRYRLVPGLF